MTLGDIIHQYRTEHSMSMDSFSEKSGISKAYISLLEKNKHPKTGKPIIPSVQIIKQASDAMNKDFNALFSSIDGNVMVGSSEQLNASIPQLDTIPIEAGYSIPVLGRVAAGYGKEAVEEVIGQIEISPSLASKGEFFALLIKGDSMIPTLYDGDTVIVERTEDANSGDLVIALVNGSDATCKRLQKYAEGIALIPQNPIYEPMRFTEAEIDSTPVRILGKVVEMRRKF